MWHPLHEYGTHTAPKGAPNDGRHIVTHVINSWLFSVHQSRSLESQGSGDCTCFAAGLLDQIVVQGTYWLAFHVFLSCSPRTGSSLFGGDR
jgi:hypothetical protein